MRRLTSMQFQALRSLGHEPWVISSRHTRRGYFILWKRKRYGQREWVTPDTPKIPYAIEKAGEDLVKNGLAEVYERRCCPGTDCHENDKLMMRLTGKGQRLLEIANSERCGRVKHREEKDSEENDAGLKAVGLYAAFFVFMMVFGPMIDSLPKPLNYILIGAFSAIFISLMVILWANRPNRHTET